MVDEGAPFLVSAPADGLPAMPAHASVASLPAPWRHDDYAWTHGAGVEGFFFVLTVVVVPFALLRWMRRLRLLARAAVRRHDSARF